MSYPTQMLVLSVQNFLSARDRHRRADCADPRLCAQDGTGPGQFLGRSDADHVVCAPPLRSVFAVLVAQGEPQDFAANVPLVQATTTTETVRMIKATRSKTPAVRRNQRVARGGAIAAARSCGFQIAIKQLGTNGGGYYSANSAHPYESTPLTNFLELLAILLIPPRFATLARWSGIAVRLELLATMLVISCRC